MVEAAPRPPMVVLREQCVEGDQNAALLAVGFHLGSRRWVAGVSWIHNIWRGGPLRALVTAWVPAERLERTRGTSHLHVPRVALTGRVDDWPVLPPVFPGANEEWKRAHQHLLRPGPDGRYTPQ